MRSRTKLALLLLLTSHFALLTSTPLLTPARAGSYDALSYEERRSLMEEHYARAVQYFNDGNYSRAIYHWQEVLQIDPEQSSPASLIAQARAKLLEQLEPLEKTLEADIAAGRYAAALAKASELVEKDSSSADYKESRKKLEAVASVRAEETGGGKVARLVRKGLAAHLSARENPKLAVNSLRYARALNPSDNGLQKLAAHVESQYPEVAKAEEAAPGMSIVEHKLFIALNHIYAGRHDLAIFACNEVLEIEPDNLLALKRKGSAYFALNQKDKAREIWRQALAIAPSDGEIKKFLNAK